LHGWTLHATDGDIGHVEDLYFDDRHWTIRYLVVNTGTWLFGRRVLISPLGIAEVDWDRRAINTHLTCEQVANSPDIDMEQPVSRQQERSYFGYYGWPVYWSGGLAWGAAAYPGLMIGPPLTGQAADRPGDETVDASPHRDAHLRSTGEVTGYGVLARDGDLGHVDDFLFDDHTWTLRYVAIATRNFWPGKKVVIPPQWLARVNWCASKVRIDHPREEIRAAPEWDPAASTERDYEERLHAHYARPGYWRGATTNTAPIAPEFDLDDEEAEAHVGTGGSGDVRR
jgi:uncharacterized protein YrrD